MKMISRTFILCFITSIILAILQLTGLMKIGWMLVITPVVLCGLFLGIFAVMYKYVYEFALFSVVSELMKTTDDSTERHEWDPPKIVKVKLDKNSSKELMKVLEDGFRKDNEGNE